MNRLKLVFSWIWDFLKPFVAVLASAIGPVLAATAESAVKAVAEGALTGDKERRDAAFDLAVANLKTQGYQIGAQVTVSMVNTAIELAVQKLKAKE
jgi:hypothetical protein